MFVYDSMKCTHCFVCDKKIILSYHNIKDWAYRKGVDMCCSYTCMSKYIDMTTSERNKQRIANRKIHEEEPIKS